MLVPTFHYTDADFHFTVEIGRKPSKFDSLLMEKWRCAEENNVLRYKFNVTDWKWIEGTNKFLAQLNLERAHNRRQPEDIRSMKMPFDPDRFNFTKIKNEEIFFDVGTGDGDNVIVPNVSPFGLGHSLFLPNRLKCLPQIATEFSIIKTIELVLLSSSPYIRGVFNSLCGHASVNHLHWHLYYLEYKMPLESIGLRQLSNVLYATEGYPAAGFCLKLSTFKNQVKDFASAVHKIVDYLQQREIAHNVITTRAKTNCENDVCDDVRVYVWARKSSIGVKSTADFIPASCEFFGHLCIRNEEAYRTLTEAKINSVFEDVTLDIFKSVEEDIVKLIS